MSQTWIESQEPLMHLLRITHEIMTFHGVCLVRGGGKRHEALLLAGQSRRRNKFPTARNHQILGRRSGGGMERNDKIPARATADSLLPAEAFPNVAAISNMRNKTQ